MSLEIAWKQNILVTAFHLLKSLLVVFGFGSQAFVCGFSRQNINSVGKYKWSRVTARGVQLFSLSSFSVFLLSTKPMWKGRCSWLLLTLSKIQALRRAINLKVIFFNVFELLPICNHKTVHNLKYGLIFTNRHCKRDDF